MATPVTIPLINPNEPEARLAALFVQEGQAITAGEAICTLETTKSAVELEAQSAGYVAGLRAEIGDTLRAGETLCYLSESPHWTPPEAPPATAAASDDQLPPGLRITQPALALARQANLDLTSLPGGALVTEKTIQALLAGRTEAGFTAPQGPFDPQAIIVYGGGGHGKSLVDLLRALGSYRIAGIIDDGLPAGEQIMGLAVLGDQSALAELAAQGVRLAVNAVGGIGNVAIRIKVFRRLAEAGFACPAVIHPAAFVEHSATLSAGVQVFPHAYVGSEARLGYGAIVNTGAVVSHDCQVDDYANISPGALLAGGVQVGAGVLVGMGATLNLNVQVGPGARIGNGATVKSDVPTNGVVRAGTIWPPEG